MGNTHPVYVMCIEDFRHNSGGPANIFGGRATETSKG